MAASFLYLINQEGEHHQAGEHRGQVFLAMTVIMLKVITKVFKGVKGLVLHFPARTSCAYYTSHWPDKKCQLGGIEWQAFAC